MHVAFIQEHFFKNFLLKPIMNQLLRRVSINKNEKLHKMESVFGQRTNIE